MMGSLVIVATAGAAYIDALVDPSRASPPRVELSVRE
jgi:hypothetical protein